MDFEALVRRVRGEFLEMPGLTLTFAQAERLWGLDEADCHRVVDALIDADFLRWTPEGSIARVDA